MSNTHNTDVSVSFGDDVISPEDDGVEDADNGAFFKDEKNMYTYSAIYGKSAWTSENNRLRRQKIQTVLAFIGVLVLYVIYVLTVQEEGERGEFSSEREILPTTTTTRTVIPLDTLISDEAHQSGKVFLPDKVGEVNNLPVLPTSSSSSSATSLSSSPAPTPPQRPT